MASLISTPATSGSAAKQDIFIRRTHIRDLVTLHKLEQLCFGQDAWGYVELIFSGLSPLHVSLVATIRGTVVGLAIGEPQAIYQRAWIANLAVHPEYRRLRIGQRLLQTCEQRLKQPYIHLTVRKTNAEAIRLYETSGYKHNQIRSRYYANGEDGIEMIKYNTRRLE